MNMEFFEIYSAVFVLAVVSFGGYALSLLRLAFLKQPVRRSVNLSIAVFWLLIFGWTAGPTLRSIYILPR